MTIFFLTALHVFFQSVLLVLLAAFLLVGLVFCLLCGSSLESEPVPPMEHTLGLLLVGGVTTGSAGGALEHWIQSNLFDIGQAPHSTRAAQTLLLLSVLASFEMGAYLQRLRLKRTSAPGRR